MSKKPSIVAIIPARYDSSRFPGKPLALLAGKPMIQHVFERTQGASLISQVVVATDDERVSQAVEKFGGRVVLTSPTHPTGTDRVAEVAAKLDADVVVNVQGDEPLITPRVIDQAVQPLLEDPALNMSTLAHRIDDPGDVDNPDVVKVLTDEQGYALAFFRTADPENSGAIIEGRLLKHIGLYVYRRRYLLKLTALEPTARERALGLEQLRPLEDGCRVKVVETEYASHGVDRPQDLRRVEEMLRARKEAVS
jgi:3-deoxy-manno-octulosonate cytidylyltransferase (CMP-KDO synthetase)